MSRGRIAVARCDFGTGGIELEGGLFGLSGSVLRSEGMGLGVRWRDVQISAFGSGRARIARRIFMARIFREEERGYFP